jgi:hypothetical protein
MTPISIDECRRLIGKPELSDAQVSEIRDALYGFARVMIQGYIWERGQKRQRGGTPEGVELYYGA